MSAERSAAIGFAVALATTCVATPLAIRIAVRVGFYDHPHDYHQHDTSTPLLGGTAVVTGFLTAAIVVGVSGQLVALIGCTLVLWLVGTIDDRFPVAPRWRLLVELGTALVLLSTGLGWNMPSGHVVDSVLTVLWVVGLVNGFNLMDNLDGACGTVACVSATGIGTLAAIRGQPTLAGLAFALAGACLAFLRWNLARPAKIFLGDGGSRPIGFLVAALAMATARGLRMGDANLFAAALMVGVVILDTALVTVSRTRRGVTLLTGGRDHLSHRLLLMCRSPRVVAVALAGTQAILCAVAIVTHAVGSAILCLVSLGAVSLGVITIAVLDRARWRPEGIAVREVDVAQPSASPALAHIDQR